MGYDPIVPYEGPLGETNISVSPIIRGFGRAGESPEITISSTGVFLPEITNGTLIRPSCMCEGVKLTTHFVQNNSGMSVSRTVIYFTFAAVLISGFFSDVEARRKVLQGRKTVTREYYSQSILPPWAKILLIGIGILLGAAVLYGILWKFLVSDLK